MGQIGSLHAEECALVFFSLAVPGGWGTYDKEQYWVLSNVNSFMYQQK